MNEIMGNILKITRVHVDANGNRTEHDLTAEEIEQWKKENMEGNDDNSNNIT